ncbi:hypothetical protein AZL_020190 [Azospirillum sp. B510]|uniref:hypothetical protein n=1 Tax=Azospirillum sp. (strain B510) TaxID=137722 RepID=UPI0001C4C370|nr:hypothetical protein [Azospirillum sp. B510]BAI71497.1 hypothetical protein AZL_008590 [Azospirillum sp. B510]BAI72657.1 hypothetical protein AZL_020190 [Azospirillum sp. B510]
MPRDIPIIFSAPMIQALLAGRKTQTRRIITKPAALDALGVFGPSFLLKPGNIDLIRYAVGDRLWVRENWQTGMTGDGPQIAYAATPDFVEINAWDGPDEGRGPSFNYDRCPGATWHHWLGDVLGADGPWRPSIHMPRWASRLTLVVEDVRVQRLQDISEEDALAEGCPAQTYEELSGMDPRGWFRDLWNSINGATAWDANPFVVALTCKVHHCNIDRLPAEGARS